MVRWGLLFFLFILFTNAECQELAFKGDTLLFNGKAQFLFIENHIYNKKDSSIAELDFQIANLQNVPLLNFKEVLLSKDDRYFSMEIIPNKKKYAVFKNNSVYQFLLEICRFQLIQNHQLNAANVLNFMLTYACELPQFQEKIVQYFPQKGPTLKVPELKIGPQKEIVQQIKITETGIISYKDSVVGKVISTSGCTYSSILQTYIIYDNDHKSIARGEYFNDEQQDAMMICIEDKRKYYTPHPQNEQSFLQAFAAILIQFNYLPVE